MIQHSLLRALFLLIPVVALLGVAVNSYFKVQNGIEFILPVEGFDPRDLLAGHYLIYRPVYKSPQDMCLQRESPLPVYYCTEEGYFVDGQYNNKPTCDLFIRGQCEDGRFVAGVERFYIPEGRAIVLDRAVRENKGSVVLAIDPKTGETRVKDFLLNGRSWREYGK
ncbi:MAG: GDYXXLXY domain-containing protein [Magnetococcales bacterium]|nr:GDYXXLXY domain-containing protein [Magnetococcales bacterium]NGZ28823.1 GDYXXLXY domain-containing protein [Magnetococcales bacterium]